MKNTIAIIVALLIMLTAISPTSAGSWDDTNTKLHVPYTILMLVDLGQTLWIVDNTYKYEETLDYAYQICVSEEIEVVPDSGQKVRLKPRCEQYRDTMPIYNTHREANPFIGTHPSKAEVYQYFIGTYVLTTWLVYALPPKWSHALQGGMISLQVYAIENNYIANVGFDF